LIEGTKTSSVESLRLIEILGGVQFLLLGISYKRTHLRCLNPKINFMINVGDLNPLFRPYEGD